MDKETLILTLAARTNQSREAAERALNAVLDIVTETLASGESVKIVGFGSFNMKKKAEIVSNSPFADAPFHIPTAFVPNFTPGKRLRDLIIPIEERGDSPC